MYMCNNKVLICSVAFISVLEAKVDFENDVLPLFQDYCMDCHGPISRNPASERIDECICSKEGIRVFWQWFRKTRGELSHGSNPK